MIVTTAPQDLTKQNKKETKEEKPEILTVTSYARILGHRGFQIPDAASKAARSVSCHRLWWLLQMQQALTRRVSE